MSLLSKITKPLRKIFQPIAATIPIVGPGISAAIGQSLVSRDRNILNRQPIPVFGPGGPPGIPPVQGFIGAPAGGMSALPRVISGGLGLIRTQTGRISKIRLPSGQIFSRRNAASMIRKVGFEVAAVALGITVVEAAELLLTESQTAARRRRRGITGAQVRNACRTARIVSRLARDLNVKPAPARRRTSACR